MCGIAGILNFNGDPVEMETLHRMNDVISHRGPDGEGSWIHKKKHLGLGHRRLSIIDLSENGAQPMHYMEDRYTITYNGEIYNYIELKNSLQAAGYSFRSDSDTEVLLALYDHKKENCLADLDGMFSFAIWDEMEQVLFCARDRFGEKPFHYFSDHNKFVFGSEIKQIWKYGIPRKVREDRLKLFIDSGQIDDERNVSSTFYEGIKRLAPAHYMKIDCQGRIAIKPYWKVDLTTEPYRGTIETAAEQFLHLLSDSVRLRLRSDVAVGSSLSGGIDSSSIVMLIDELKGEKQEQNTFSARFKNFEKDEGAHIEKVLKSCKNVKGNYIWPDENYFMEVFDKVNFHQDEPYGSSSIIAQYAVMELALKNNITVLLDGQGADEYLAGYLPYYKLYLDQLFFNDRTSYKNELLSYNTMHPSELRYVSLDQEESLRMKLGRYKRQLLKQKPPFSENALKNKLHADTFGNGLQILLRYADRNAMAHSREVRLPFLSHKLVEFVFTLPDNYKLHSGWTKYVLRKAVENILPAEICWRKDKIGYASPQSKWLESGLVQEEISRSANRLGLKINGKETEPSKRNENNWRLLMAAKFA